MVSTLPSLLSLLLLFCGGASVSGDNDAFMKNYNDFVKDGEAFLYRQMFLQPEHPGKNGFDKTAFEWWCDFEFSSFANGTLVGYTGRVVAVYPPETMKAIVDSGIVDITFLDTTPHRPYLVTAVSTPNNNFQGRVQSTHDNHFFSFSDYGNSVIPAIASEGHDAGTYNEENSWTQFGIYEVISKEEMAKALGYDVSDMTTELCTDLYNEAWLVFHPEEEETASAIVEDEPMTKKEKTKNEKSKKAKRVRP